MKTAKGCLSNYLLSEKVLDEESLIEVSDEYILAYMVTEGYIEEDDLLDENLMAEILLDEGIRSMARTTAGAVGGYGASTIGIMMRLRGLKKQLAYAKKELAGAKPERKQSLQSKIDQIENKIDWLQMNKGKIKAAATIGGAVAGRATIKGPIGKLQKKLQSLQAKNASKEQLDAVKQQIADEKTKHPGLIKKVTGLFKNKKAV